MIHKKCVDPHLPQRSKFDKINSGTRKIDDYFNIQVLTRKCLAYIQGTMVVMEAPRFLHSSTSSEIKESILKCRIHTQDELVSCSHYN